MGLINAFKNKEPIYSCSDLLCHSQICYKKANSQIRAARQT